MKKTKINSPDFAERIGAYSHGYKIEIGNRVEIEVIAVKEKK